MRVFSTNDSIGQLIDGALPAAYDSHICRFPDYVSCFANQPAGDGNFDPLILAGIRWPLSGLPA
jgi:hypothetical protein